MCIANDDITSLPWTQEGSRLLSESNNITSSHCVYEWLSVKDPSDLWPLNLSDWLKVRQSVRWTSTNKDEWKEKSPNNLWFKERKRKNNCQRSSHSYDWSKLHGAVAANQNTDREKEAGRSQRGKEWREYEKKERGMNECVGKGGMKKWRGRNKWMDRR